MSRKNITRDKIIETASRMFIERGYTNVCHRDIAEELDISPGNITYYFPGKEDLLLELAKKITSFHSESIERVIEKGALYAYCWEVTAQIVLCEDNPEANDLYLALYTNPHPFHYVKEWTAQKNYTLLGERLKLELDDFLLIENVACCIERSALTEPCSESYTLDKKIALTLDALLKIFDIPGDERIEVIGEILKTDFHEVQKKLVKEFKEKFVSE